VNLGLFLLLAAGSCPAHTPTHGAPGLVAVAKLPTDAAMRENAEGKRLYREERFAEARGKYRAALAADPDFLGAQLNLACAYSREGRYGDAADEAIKLVRAAYVPWQREVREATDLGILQNQMDYARVTQAMAAAAREWGGQLGKAVMFVARTRPPVNVAGEGVLVLRLNQEIFAWNPLTGRYFQVTAEDGRVLGFVRSADGRRIAYLLGGKLVRQPGRSDAFRELSVRVLEMADMTLGRGFPIAAEASKVELRFFATPEIRLTGPSGETTLLRLGETGWEEISTLRKSDRLSSLVLTSAGIEPEGDRIKHAGCSFDLVSQRDTNGLPQIEVRRADGKRFSLDARYGAGRPGLLFPDGSPPAPAPKQPAKNDRK
jgi:hypothetical protein